MNSYWTTLIELLLNYSYWTTLIELLLLSYSYWTTPIELLLLNYSYWTTLIELLILNYFYWTTLIELLLLNYSYWTIPIELLLLNYSYWTTLIELMRSCKCFPLLNKMPTINCEDSAVHRTMNYLESIISRYLSLKKMEDNFIANRKFTSCIWTDYGGIDVIFIERIMGI